MRAGIDARGEHGGERLRAETDADHGRALLDGSLDGLQLVLEEGIAVDLVDADGAAEHEKEIGVQRRRQVVSPGLQILEADAALLEHGAERAGILEGDMVDGDGILHDVPPSALGPANLCAGRARRVVN